MSTKIASSSEYIAKYLADEECKNVFAYLQSAPYNVYTYARLEKWIGLKRLTRAPKVEWYITVDGNLRAIYRWGQEALFENAGYPMPTLMQSIVTKIKRDFGEDVNHAIAICYHSGVEQHAPPHQDKAVGVKAKKGVPLDMAEESSFFVFSFGDPRMFTLQTTANDKKTERGVVWEEALAHGSLLRVSAKDNRSLYHAVHKASIKNGPRYSLIFRNVVTTRPIDAAKEAEANSDIYRFVPPIFECKHCRTFKDTSYTCVLTHKRACPEKPSKRQRE
jgi:hypothetical protein